MTVFYVDSAAVGLNDGTSPTNAWVLIASAVTNVTTKGDIVYTSHAHSETPAATMTQAWSSNGIKVISADFGNIVGGFPVRRFGAALKPTGSGSDIVNTGDIYMSGFDMDSPDKFTLGAGGVGGFNIYEGCTLELTDDGILTSGEGSTTTFIDTDFNQVTNDFMSMARASVFEMFGGSYTRAAGSNGCWSIGTTQAGVRFEFSGADLTGIPAATPFIQTFSRPIFMSFSKCKMNSSFTIGTLLAGTVVELVNCEVGTLTAAAFTYQRFDFYGESETVLTHFRTGGADDGEQANAYSQKVTALANQTIKGFRSTMFPVSFYIDDEDNGSKTFKIHMAHAGVGSGTAGALQDDEVWLQVTAPSDAGTPIALGFSLNTVADDNQVSDLATEAGETWNGTGVGTKQSISFSYSPTINGTIEIEVHFATSSASDVIIYVDPKIEVS